MAQKNTICNVQDPLSLGFYGSVVFQTSNTSLYGQASKYYNIPRKILCSRFNINTKQQTNLLKNIDTNIDTSIYNVQTLQVGGSISLPVVFNIGDNQIDYIKNLFLLCVEKDLSAQRTNKISNTIDIIAKYSSVSYSKFYQCLVNSFSIYVKQSAPVQLSLQIIGKDRSNSRQQFYTEKTNNQKRNQRVATWNDISVNFCFNGKMINGCTVRGFDLQINNNLEKIYTLNGNVTPVDVICSQQRNINGNIKLSGRNEYLSNYSYSNMSNKVHGSRSGNFNRCNADDSLLLTINSLCKNSYDILNIGIPGVIYQIQQMQLGPDSLIQSSIKYKSVPGQGFSLNGGVNCCGVVVDKNFIG